ncbi:MAG: STAS domain-containing protein [Coleofasciculaceae cyanobacterium RL_1_1]|nr:STAS domain-containing protein [Coleofasciculaceae cyanobacterium RL_1_1]
MAFFQKTTKTVRICSLNFLYNLEILAAFFTMTLNAFVFQPQELFDGIAGPRIQRQVVQCLAQNPDVILIDFEQVKFIDSIGLGALVGALKHVNDSGKQLYLCSLCEQASAMFKLTSMEQVFTIFSDRQAFERSVLNRQISKRQQTIIQRAA